jgi:hypothetical protein
MSGVPEPGERSAIAFPPAPPAPTSAHPSPRRNVSIVVSVVALCLLLLGGGFLINSATRPEVDTSPSPATGAPEAPASEHATTPSSSTASLLDAGWKLHTAKDGAFTLALPPSWSRYTKPIPGFKHHLKFAAWGSPVEKHQEAWLYVFRWPDYSSGQVEETYWEQEQAQIGSDPAAVGVSELREIEVPDGVFYIFTSVFRSPHGGRRTETCYCILHGGYEYRLVFLVPLEQKDKYDFLFDDMAKSFEVVE